MAPRRPWSPGPNRRTTTEPAAFSAKPESKQVIFSLLAATSPVVEIPYIVPAQSPSKRVLTLAQVIQRACKIQIKVTGSGALDPIE